jgi:Flp pilus assembly protein TadD
VEAQEGLGRVAFERGQYGSAARYFERALRRRPRSTGLRVILGSAYLRLGQTDRAVSEWETVLRLDPDNRAARRLLDSVR